MKKLVTACILFTFLLSGCAAQGTLSTSPQTAAPQVSAASETASTSIHDFIMGGVVSSNETAAVSSKISGKVSAINVDIGSNVAKGQVLITLDSSDLKAQINQAAASVATAKANLTNAASAARPEQIAQSKATLASALQNYNYQQAEYNRSKSLFDDGALAKSQLDAASVQLASAQSQLKNAQEQLALQQNGPTKTSLDIYKAQLVQSEAALSTAQTSYNNSVITAPISGKVSAKNINVGELASPGASLISIVNSDAIYVNAYLPADYIQKAKVGQKVTIKISELDSKLFSGEISMINSVVNSESKDILTKVTINDPDKEIKPGMFAEISLK